MGLLRRFKAWRKGRKEIKKLKKARKDNREFIDIQLKKSKKEIAQLSKEFKEDFHGDWQKRRLPMHVGKEVRKGASLEQALKGIQERYFALWRKAAEAPEGRAKLVLKIDFIEKLLEDPKKMEKFKEEHKRRFRKF